MSSASTSPRSTHTPSRLLRSSPLSANELLCILDSSYCTCPSSHSSISSPEPSSSSTPGQPERKNVLVIISSKDKRTTSELTVRLQRNSTRLHIDKFHVFVKGTESHNDYRPFMPGPFASVTLSAQQPNSEKVQLEQPVLKGPLAAVTLSGQQPNCVSSQPANAICAVRLLYKCS